MLIKGTFSTIKNKVEACWEWLKTPMGICGMIGFMLLLSGYAGINAGNAAFLIMLILTSPLFGILWWSKRIALSK